VQQLGPGGRREPEQLAGIVCGNDGLDGGIGDLLAPAGLDGVAGERVVVRREDAGPG
jgi:hypothetical protein